MSSPIAVDFESFYSTKLKYGLRTMIPESYCSHELFDPYLVSVCDGTTRWSGSPKDLNWESLRGKVWLSHNARFDATVYAEMVKRGMVPGGLPTAYHCTANLTAYLCNRRSLQEAVEHLFGHRVSKDYRKVADNRHWPQDFSEEEQKQIIEAGLSDTQECWNLWNRFSDQWPTTERELSRITVEQGMRGVQIDTQRLNDYIWMTHEMLQNTEKVIPWIAGAEEDWDEFNTKPTSTKCIAEQCRRTQIPCPPIKSDDEEGYAEWEATYGKAHPWIAAVGAWRSINKLYRTFVTVKERLRSDGTLPFSLKYFGAHTGRWSGDARVNMQNMRRKPMLCNDAGLLETDEKRIDLALDELEETGKTPEWVRYVIDFRSLVIPRPGKKMIVSDLAQIEPRMLAWITGNWELLRRVADGESLYEAHARTTMGFTGGTLDSSSDVYRLAKARVLALGYGCGWQKFIKMAWNLARIDVTKDDPEWIDEIQPFTNKITQTPGYGFNSRRIVKEFRDQNPNITALWQRLQDGFRSSIGDRFVMELPSGRKMRYEDVRSSVRIEKDPVTEKPRRVTVFTADIGGKRFPFYGGKLCENLIQAVARDVFGEHIVLLEKAGVTNLFGVHDEAVVEVDPDVSAGDIKTIMSTCPEWLKGCPISAKAHEVSYYCK